MYVLLLNIYSINDTYTPILITSTKYNHLIYLIKYINDKCKGVKKSKYKIINEILGICVHL